MTTERFLLDTNVLSEPVRPRPNMALVQRLQQHERHCFTAAPVWHELNAGVLRLPKGRRRAMLVRYLQQLAGSQLLVLPYDQRAAGWHARERARLTLAGRTPPLVDGQIAAIAVVRAMTLVTCNVSDFSEFSRLKVVDWTAGTTSAG